MVVCKYCSAEVPEDVFKEQKDKRKRTIFKGKCPSCGRINITYPKREEVQDLEPEPEPEIPEPEPEITPEEEPEISEEGEQVKEIVEGIVTSPQVQEAIEKEKDLEAEWEKTKKHYQIAVMIMIGIIICLIAVSLWLWTRSMEKEKRKIGSTEDKTEEDEFGD